jgi:hypothetical protein
MSWRWQAVHWQLVSALQALGVEEAWQPVADATGNGCVAPSGLIAARWRSTRLIPTRPGRAGIATAGAVRPRKQAYFLRHQNPGGVTEAIH